jgi:hypothetical protein
MKQREIYLLLISSFVLVVIWIGFSIYHSSITSTIPQTTNIQIIPINPNFDMKTISNIKTRPTVVPLYELDKTTSDTLTPTPTLIPTITPEVSNTPITTSGGVLNR